MSKVYLKTAIFYILLFLYSLGAVLYSQEAPALTEPQRLKLQLAIKEIETTQLRLVLAQRDVEQAKQSAQEMLKTLTVPGWSLDLSTMSYTKTPDKVEK